MISSECADPRESSDHSRAQFLRFAIVGAAGFLVDAGTLHLAVREIGAGLYTGRVLSYFAAATFTWWLNRRYTFRNRRNGNRAREYLAFLAANAVGGLLNYTVYAISINASNLARDWPIIAVAAGSLTGLVSNFILSKRFVFGRS